MLTNSKKEHNQDLKEDLEKKDEGCCDDGETKQKYISLPGTKNPTETLLLILGIIFILNFLVMGLFTFRMSGKLDEAISITKPQEGTLLVVVPEECPLCGAMDIEKSFVEKQNVDLLDTRTVSAESEEGQSLIKKYKFEHLPAMLFLSDDTIKSSVKKVLQESSKVVDENTLVWEDKIPPYLNMEDNKILGLVDVIYLADASCTECYDVRQVQRSILAQFGVAVNSETLLDIQSEEGQELLARYTITSVPTIILSSEVDEYATISNIWSQVGTKEQDGTFVFRKNEALGKVTYNDLKTNKVIIPEKE